MYQGKYIFSQITDVIVRYQFNQCVERCRGDYWIKNFSCWEQFMVMAYGQLALRESLRSIVICLTSQREKLYHLGFRSSLSRITIQYANEQRDWRIYRDLAQILIKQASALYAGDALTKLDLDGAVYLIDSTTIELALSLFPWARLVKIRAAIKLNLELSLVGSIPSFFDFSSGREHDVFFLDRLCYEAGAYYVMDRGYLAFTRLHVIHEAKAFFITRAKDNTSYRRQRSRPSDETTGVRSDQSILLSGYQAKKNYPEKLRRIRYYDAVTDRYYVFLTNNFELDAFTIAELYKSRWQIELFFKWIKQHLCIKSFWGRSENAVKTQICIALCAYLMVAIVKKQLRIERSNYDILQIVSISLFDKISLAERISEFPVPILEDSSQIQARLWDY